MTEKIVTDEQRESILSRARSLADKATLQARELNEALASLNVLLAEKEAQSDSE